MYWSFELSREQAQGAAAATKKDDGVGGNSRNGSAKDVQVPKDLGAVAVIDGDS